MVSEKILKSVKIFSLGYTVVRDRNICTYKYPPYANAESHSPAGAQLPASTRQLQLPTPNLMTTQQHM